MFPSASQHQHVEKSRFTWPWEPNQVYASFPTAFWTQTNFFLGSLLLSLVSQKLVGYVSLSFTAPTCGKESFPQPGFSKTCWGTFPSASRHQHIQKSRFTWPWDPNQHIWFPQHPAPPPPPQTQTRHPFREPAPDLSEPVLHSIWKIIKIVL
jgi:hypothetical protein